MAKIEEVKTQIIDSRLTEIQKNDLIGILSVVGPGVLNFIYKRVSSSNFAEEAEELCLLLLEEANAYKALLAGDISVITALLTSAPENPDYGFGELVIPFAQDARQYMQTHGSPDFDQVLKTLNDFEAKVLHWLPEVELNEIVKNNLLYFVRSINIVMEFKRVYLLEELSDDGTWGQNLRVSVENNAEKLGVSSLTRDDKTYPPTVANWLKDYISYITKPLTERVAFDQVQYIERAPNVQRLNAYERKDLLEIIKLHAWLMNPEVTEAEVEAYETELSKRAKSVVSEPVAKVISQPKLAPQPPVAPAPKAQINSNDWMLEAAKRRAEEQQKIDSKIEELKKKANN